MNTGEWLKLNRKYVLKTLEDKLKTAVPPARPIDAPVLTNSIPDLYDSLTEALAVSGDPPAAETLMKHFKDKQNLFRGYDLDFVIQEFHILHHVILETARKYKILGPVEADAILNAINEGVMQAASEFVKIRWPNCFILSARPARPSTPRPPSWRASGTKSKRRWA